MPGKNKLIIGLLVFPILSLICFYGSFTFFSAKPIVLEELDKVTDTVSFSERTTNPQKPSQPMFAVYLGKGHSQWRVHYTYIGKARMETLVNNLKQGEPATIYFRNKPGLAKTIIQLEAGGKILVPASDSDDAAKMLAWIALIMGGTCALATFLQYRSFRK